MYNLRLEEYMNFLYKMNKNWLINLKPIKFKKTKKMCRCNCQLEKQYKFIKKFVELECCRLDVNEYILD